MARSRQRIAMIKFRPYVPGQLLLLPPKYGFDKPVAELPKELARRQSRLATIQKDRAALKEETRMPAEVEEQARLKKEGKEPRQANRKTLRLPGA